eukprot:4209690-Pyramimonas_sp.AAC.1
MEAHTATCSSAGLSAGRASGRRSAPASVAGSSRIPSGAYEFPVTWTSKITAAAGYRTVSARVQQPLTSTNRSGIRQTRTIHIPKPIRRRHVDGRTRLY